MNDILVDNFQTKIWKHQNLKYFLDEEVMSILNIDDRRNNVSTTVKIRDYNVTVAQDYNGYDTWYTILSKKLD